MVKKLSLKGLLKTKTNDFLKKTRRNVRLFFEVMQPNIHNIKIVQTTLLYICKKNYNKCRNSKYGIYNSKLH